MLGLISQKSPSSLRVPMPCRPVLGAVISEGESRKNRGGIEEESTKSRGESRGRVGEESGKSRRKSGKSRRKSGKVGEGSGESLGQVVGRIDY